MIDEAAQEGSGAAPQGVGVLVEFSGNGDDCEAYSDAADARKRPRELQLHRTASTAVMAMAYIAVARSTIHSNVCIALCIV